MNSPDDASRPDSSGDPTVAAAAWWLARRDRGLTAAEQDEFLEWLHADPAHRQALARLDRTWAKLDALGDPALAYAAQPNPDLLAPPRRRRNWFAPALVAASVAALVVIGLNHLRDNRADPVAATPPGVRVIPRPEKVTLPDGSTVEVNHGGRIETAFTATERRIRLVQGEAHFTVSKDAARPFIVSVGAVAVRAVGTAFDVRRDSILVAILVTEGQVVVERVDSAAGKASVPTPVDAGERAVVTLAGSTVPEIVPVSPSEIERALAWQGVRLEFSDMPLADVVAEFNLRNRRQLVIGDTAAAKVRVGGSFRADNVDAFVRLLEASFGIAVEHRSDGSAVLHAREALGGKR